MKTKFGSAMGGLNCELILYRPIVISIKIPLNPQGKYQLYELDSLMHAKLTHR